MTLKDTKREVDDGSIIAASKIRTVKVNPKDVYTCAWNPTCDLLGSGSGGGVALIWDINDNPASRKPFAWRPCNYRRSGRLLPISKHVIAVDWNYDGTLLAAGSYDGNGRIWTTNGKLNTTLSQHQGPIMALKWNDRGNYILTAGFDRTTIIWDASSGQCTQQFSFHSSTALDIDWQTNTTFASCSADQFIHVCRLSVDEPIKSFQGHTNEIGAVKWNPQGNLLASCSDDKTVKIWSMRHDRCVVDLRAHSEEVFTVKWSPTGPGTLNPNMNLILASASLDSSVRLWDVERGATIHTLTKRNRPAFITGVAFSPDGKFLATGSLEARCVRIWSTQSGQLVHSYNGTQGILDVCWNFRGDKVAACGTSGMMYVIDMRKL